MLLDGSHASPATLHPVLEQSSSLAFGIMHAVVSGHPTVIKGDGVEVVNEEEVSPPVLGARGVGFLVKVPVGSTSHQGPDAITENDDEHVERGESDNSLQEEGESFTKSHLLTLGLVVHQRESGDEPLDEEKQTCNECDACYEHEFNLLPHGEDILRVVIQAVPGEEVGVGPYSIDQEEADQTIEELHILVQWRCLRVYREAGTL